MFDTNVENFIQQFLKDEPGITIVEYAVAGSLVTEALVSVFVALGNTVVSQIDRIRTAGW